MTFHVGQKVVCVRDTWEPPPTACGTGYVVPHRPKADVEYIIRSVATDEGFVCLRLAWLMNPEIKLADGRRLEPQFTAMGVDGILNFKPVVEKKTDISIFTEMLKPHEIAKTRELCGND